MLKAGLQDLYVLVIANSSSAYHASFAGLVTLKLEDNMNRCMFDKLQEPYCLGAGGLSMRSGLGTKACRIAKIDLETVQTNMFLYLAGPSECCNQSAGPKLV